MSLTVNGQSQVPPGFRFHPTEEELLHYYLKKKVAYEKIDLDVIRDVDLNKLEPWDIQEKCKIGSTPQNDWYFFSHKDKKYPTGTRTNRATAAGFWKATGRDKVIYSNFMRIGMRKTLVFYKGRAPHGQKSDWIMHEYRLDDTTTSITNDTNAANSMGEMTQEEGWVVCRVFKKKNHHKSFDTPNNSSNTSTGKTHFLNSSSDGALDQILHFMGRACKKEENSNNILTNNNNETTNNYNASSTVRYFQPPYDMAIVEGVDDRFMQLPPLESPPLQACSSQTCYHPIDTNVITDSEASITNHGQGTTNLDPVYHTEQVLSDWAALDHLVASHLNGQTDTPKQISCFNYPNMAFNDQDLQLPHLRSTISSNRLYQNSQEYNSSEIDLWNFTRSSSSSSDPLCHMSNSSA